MEPPFRDTLICPHCQTRNAEAAVVCHFCGGDLPKTAMTDGAAEKKGDDGILPTVPMVHRGVAEWFMREGNCCLVALVLALLPWVYWIVIAVISR